MTGIVHRAAELRMRMQDQRDRAAGIGLVVIARFEAAGGAVDDQLGHWTSGGKRVADGRYGVGVHGDRRERSADGQEYLTSPLGITIFPVGIRTFEAGEPDGPACSCGSHAAAAS